MKKLWNKLIVNPWFIGAGFISLALICLTMLVGIVKKCSHDFTVIQQTQHQKCLDDCKNAGHPQFDCEYQLCK
jgi:hypothetical protein